MKTFAKETFIALLWDQFFAKIEREWEKYEDYGENFNELADNGNQLNFALAVRQDIVKTFQKKHIDVDVVGENTLHRYFQRGGISRNVKDKSLEMLSWYLGYQGWGHFQHIHQLKAMKPTSRETTISNRPSEGAQAPFFLKKRILSPVLFLTLLVVSLFIFYSLRLEQPVYDDDYFTDLIREANEAEFRAYMALPEIDTAGFDRYFTREGMAKKSILGALYNSSSKNRTLLEPPSSYTILDVEVVQRSDEEVRVETTEKWYLLMCDHAEPRGYLYDTLNNQLYLLKKEDELWKIDVNHYEGQARHPATPPPCN